MKASALAISMILILVPLAGCSGSDTEVTVDMDSEDLQGIIDDNREDFLNNTTVVVFQEYHNNTTVVNQYSNNTTNNMDQSGTSTSTTTYNYNGSSEESELFVVRLEWDWSDLVGETTLKRDNNFTVEYSYYDYPTNDDRTDVFTLPCSNYYDAPVQSSNSTNPSYWNSNGDVQDDYWDWWDYLYNNTIRDLLSEVAYWGTVEDSCRESQADHIVIDNSEWRVYIGDGNYYYDYSLAPKFLELTIPNGSAFRIVQINTNHEYTTSLEGGWPQTTSSFWTVNGISPNGCDGLSAIVNSHYDECGDLWGGWEEIHLEFNLRQNVYHDSKYEFTMYYELVPVTNV